MPAAIAQTGLSPVEVVERSYAEMDHSDRLPGGSELWASAIMAEMEAMLARREAAGMPEREAHPAMLAGQDEAQISVELMEQSGETATVRGIYDAGRGDVVTIFSLVREDGDWKIGDSWREDAPDQTLKALLGTLPREE